MAVSGVSLNEAEGFFPHLQALKIDGKAPELCTPEIMSAIFRQHLQSPSIWAIFPIQVTLDLSPPEFRMGVGSEMILLLTLHDEQTRDERI